MGRIMSPAFRAKDAATARAMYHVACDMLRDCCPKAADVAEEAEPDALAYLAFPPSHWKRLRTNNVQERANREIKRRSRVVQVFPSERSLERLVGAVMCELDEQWSESRYFAYGKIQELCDEKRKKEPEGAGRPAADLAEAARKMIIASLELAEKVDAA
nr:transposase [uncultured Senegalimassilia sp.]